VNMSAKKYDEIVPKLQIEALLFSSGKTMSEEQLVTLTGLSTIAVRNALKALQQEYEERNGAIVIFNDPTGWKMMVRDRYVGVVKNIVAETELSRATLETLAVIAYKYPKILQSEVINTRGSGAYDHMAELEKLGFINREPSGRSFAVKLTEKFFNYFDVAGGKDIREVFKNVRMPKKPEGQKTLGELEVVDVKKPEVHDKLGMEVVDVSEQVGHADEQEHKGFLEDIDKKINALTQKNNEHDDDELLKRKPLPGMEETNEDVEKSEEK
jgi:segregation and condensation protein B